MWTLAVRLIGSSGLAAAALPSSPDWLVEPASTFGAATVSNTTGGARIVLGNALIEREFTLSPDFACVSFRSLMHTPPSEILRAVQPEALVQLDGVSYHIGGLVVPPTAAGNCSADACPSAAHLGVWTDKGTLGKMVRNESAFNYVSHSTGTPKPQFEWAPGTRHAPTNVAWPAKGVTLSVTFAAPATAVAAHRQLEVIIHYELFSGAPVVTKSLTIAPKPGVSPKDVAHIVVTGATVEYLSVTQPYSPLALYSYAPPTRDEPYGAYTSTLCLQALCGLHDAFCWYMQNGQRMVIPGKVKHTTACCGLSKTLHTGKWLRGRMIRSLCRGEVLHLVWASRF